MAIERKPTYITRDAVILAMAEYDKIGRDAFLAEYGFRQARTHMVWHEGNSYDSKAIVGAAFGYLPGRPVPLRSNEFYGGQPSIIPLKREGFSFDPPADQLATKRNPNWSRDEVILALDLYFKHNGRDPGDTHPDVIALSVLLREMAGKEGVATFRNPNGVAMKLMNLRSLDPAFTSSGGKGLASASKQDRAVWDEFSGDRLAIAIAAEAIREGIVSELDDDILDEIESYEAKEGRVSYRLHKHLERDRKIISLKKQAVMKEHGKLECEACSFDFHARYGVRGEGCIDAHHMNPVHAMEEGSVTKMDDLALLCPNCHRMVHAAKPWLTLDQLRALLESPV